MATVDSYQGKENDIIILNLVRSNLKHNVGFLREKRRLNVAVSRSIDYLLIVADIKTLKNCRLPDICTLLRLLAEKQVSVKEYRCSSNNIREINCCSLQGHLELC